MTPGGAQPSAPASPLPSVTRRPSLSLNFGVARLYLWRDGFRRFGLTLDASDLRDAW